MKMYADGADISIYGAELLNLDIQTATIDTERDWLRKALAPLILFQQFQYKAITAEIRIEGTSREDALTKASDLTNTLKKATLQFEGIDYYYDATLDSHQIAKTLRLNKLTLTCTFSAGYAYKPQITETANRVGSKTINNAGNIDTPAIIEITPSIDLQNIIITGLSEDSITINNLTSGNMVIIDGEAGTVLQGSSNKFSDTDMWEFPKLAPGANTITFSQVNCDINIKYKPKWI